jgi:uncharacterized RDD family membrane protein YckC
MSIRKLSFIARCVLLGGMLSLNAPAAQDAPAPANPPPAKGGVFEDVTPEAPAAPLAPRFRNNRRGGGENFEPVVVVRDTATVPADETCPAMVVVLGKVDLQGGVRQDAVIVGSDGEINGVIGGDLILVMSNVKIGPKAEIHGQMTVVGPQPEIADGVRIRRGPTVNLGIGPVRSLPEYIVSGPLLGRPFPPGVRWAWYVVFTAFALTFLICLLFPRPVSNCAQTLRDRPFACFFAGVAFKVLALLVPIVLAFTLVLIPAIPFVICLIFAASLFGKAALCVAIGQLLWSARDETGWRKPAPQFLLGAVLIYCLYMVPVVGMFVFLLVSPTTLGAALLSRFGVPRPQKVAPPGPGPERRDPANLPPAPFAPSPEPSAFAFQAPAEPFPASPQTVPAASLAILHSSVPGSGGPLPGLPNPEPPPPAGDPYLRAGSSAAPAFPPLIPPLGGGRASIAEVLVRPRAGFFWRLAATILDFVIVYSVLELNPIHWFARHRGPFDQSGSHGAGDWFLLLWLGYHVGMWVWRGTTVGGAIFGLKCVRTNGEPLDWTVAIVRALGSCLSFFALGIGFFWVAWDRDRQSWHDKISDTMIVKMPRSISLVP